MLDVILPGWDSAIIAVAVDIPRPIISRFTAEVLNDTEVAVAPHIVTGPPVNGGPFNKARCLNRAIRVALRTHDVIVCTDIDMLVPPGLIAHTAEHVRSGYCVWAVARNISPHDIEPRRWTEWLDLPLRWSGKGSWSAMTADDWRKTGGWDERLTGWGGEDDAFFERRERLGIKTLQVTQFPLMHVNHEPRLWRSPAHPEGCGNPDNLKFGQTPYPQNYLVDTA